MLKLTDPNGTISGDLYKSINLAILGTIDTSLVRMIVAGIEGNNLKFWYVLKDKPVDSDGFDDIYHLIQFYIRNDFHSLEEIDFKVAVLPEGKCDFAVVFDEKHNGSELTFFTEYNEHDYCQPYKP